MDTTPITVLETKTGWMIKCRSCGWHEFPKVGKPGASWTFNGDRVRPTFSPSMNSLLKFSEAVCAEDRRPDRRCHFTIADGEIKYCEDCTHDLRGQTLPLEPWPEAEVKMNAATKEYERW